MLKPARKKHSCLDDASSLTFHLLQLHLSLTLASLLSTVDTIDLVMLAPTPLLLMLLLRGGGTGGVSKGESKDVLRRGGACGKESVASKGCIGAKSSLCFDLLGEFNPMFFICNMNCLCF